jgi:rsbT co-antagonist protein RsbR
MNGQESDMLQARVAFLQQRVEELEQQLMHAQSSQQRTEKEFQQIQFSIDRVSDSIFWVDSEARICYANNAVCDTLGYTREELLNMSVANIDPFFRLDKWQHYWESIKQQGSMMFESQQQCKDGTVFPVEIRMTFLTFDNQEFIYASAHDITNRKKMEHDLRQSQAFLQGVLDNVPALVSVVNTQGEFLFSNQLAASFTPFTAEEIVGKTFDEIMPPDAAEISRKNDAYVLQTGHTLETETVIPKDDVPHTFITTRFPIFHGDGTIQAVGNISLDITERKQMEEELRVSETRYRSIHQNAPVGIFRTSQDGRFIDVNPALVSMFGYSSPQEFLHGNLNARDLYMYPEERDRLLQQASEEENIFLFESRFRRKDGSEMVGNLSLWRVYDDHESVLCIEGFVEDVTDRKRAEEERAAFQQHIIEAQRATLRELSSPLIPLSQDVVLMPLIGTIDTNRAQQIMETLLEGIALYQADHAIVDITGVNMVDTQVAQALVRTAQAVRLLGAQIILTGIQPQIAQTLVRLGADMGDIITRGNLQSGISHAMNDYSNIHSS